MPIPPTDAGRPSTSSDGLRPPRTTLPRPTDRLTLGAAGLRVSPFCLGWVEAPEAIGAAFDRGINFFFLSADLHWPRYEPARRGLERLLARGPRIRDEVVVAATSYCTQTEFPTGALIELVDAVAGLGRVDVAVAGGAYAGELLERLKLFRRIRGEGFLGARAIGASFHDRGAALLAANHGLVDVAFARYNAVHAGARKDLFPRLAPGRTTPLYNFKSTLGYLGPEEYADLGIDAGGWQPRITDHYRFVLARPEVDGLLLSLTTPAEVAAFGAALEEGPLTEPEEEHLLRLGREYRRITGRSAPARPRPRGGRSPGIALR